MAYSFPQTGNAHARHPYSREVIKSHKSPEKSHIPVGKGKKPGLKVAYHTPNLHDILKRQNSYREVKNNKWFLGTPGKRKSWL